MRALGLALLTAALFGSPAPALADPTAAHAMVSAANPIAARAGLEVLKAGGTAADAAVAVQAVLGLVEPQSSGLGGGAFLIYYDARTGRTRAYDGRETAPAGAAADMFLGPDGRPMSKLTAILGGRSTGVPGAVAMLGLAQREHGALPWGRLLRPAERLAETGFVVSPRLAGMITGPAPQASQPDMAAYFTGPDGARLKAGDTLRNPAYARTLRRLERAGPDALYKGQIPRDIVARVRAAPLPGTLGEADFAAYRPREAPALCRPYRVWTVCTANDPSGGPALLEGLGLLERTDIAARGPGDPAAWVELAAAERLMYADRDYYAGDPPFAHPPTAGLLDPAYLDARARLITPDLGAPPGPGHPPGADAPGPDHTREPGGTSHFVIVDARGDVASVTTTVESVFGSGRMVDGFVLNNQLTDFSFDPLRGDGRPAANAPAPGKRPRSSMSPVIVFDRSGRFVAALGSPGGTSIPAYNLKALVAILDWRMTPSAALALPNLIAHGPVFTTEPDRFAPGVLDALKAHGLVFVTPPWVEDSGLHAVIASPAGYVGAADPRREGVAVGY